MGAKFILAFDQGTTSSRAILFDRDGQRVGTAQEELPQIYPRPGWVEHDALRIWESQIGVGRRVLAQTGARAEDVAAIGITNQRETTVVWDRHTGQPVCNAIVWQCRRTAELCDALKARGWAERIQRKTGLVIDAYFSGTKLKWILDHVPGARARAVAGDLLFGTVDTWLIWKLTGGRVHATDYSNASRTLLYNIRELTWDEELLKELEIPVAMLPEVRPSSGLYGTTDPAFLGGAIPIAGDAGDQQAALFGQGCFDPGTAKNTYGTGCFLLMHTGLEPRVSRNGLLTTIAWGIDGRIEYALEGSVFTAGAVVQWLRDEMQLVESAAQTEDYANSVEDTHGVYLVPAFTGLGAPYWDMYARGTIVGLTRGARREHVVRAALEAIAYQTKDVLNAMQEDSGIALDHLQVDGGAAANAFLMQFQADMLGVSVRKPEVVETTALGASYLAGLAVGFWRDQAELRGKARIAREFAPGMAEDRRAQLYQGWRAAVRRAMLGSHESPLPEDGRP
jgi:glycerol kinase